VVTVLLYICALHFIIMANHDVLKTASGGFYLLDNDQRRYKFNNSNADGNRWYWKCIDDNCGVRAISDKPDAQGNMENVVFKKAHKEDCSNTKDITISLILRREIISQCTQTGTAR
jgi:hypothetical protein